MIRNEVIQADITCETSEKRNIVEKMSWIREDGLSWYHKFCMEVLKRGPLPKHIAIIMDGNRRYANKEHVEKKAGHTKGFDKLSETLLWCREMGILEVTVYAFSIENFKRSAEEVQTLMDLAYEKYAQLLSEKDKLKAHGVCIRVLGNLSLLPERLRKVIAQAVLLTKDNKTSFLNVAFAYTSRDEITNAMEMIRQGVQEGDITKDDINQALLTQCMYSSKCSKPDILIRTSGEVRFSDYLLWQSYNSNVIFERVLWPDFNVWHFLICIFHYQRHYKDQIDVEKQLGNECYHAVTPATVTEATNNRRSRFAVKVQQKHLQQMQLYAKA